MNTRLAGGNGESICLPAIQAHALWAETYDLPVNPLLALEERTMDPLLPAVSGRCILDVACGTGRWLGRLIGRGASRTIGVDISKEMLHVASGKLSSRAKLIRADCLALPIQDGLTDLAVCSFAISYLPNLSSFASELARVSRCHGHVFVTDFHPCGYDRGWKRAFRYGDQVIEIASYVHSINSIREAFVRAGFEVMRCIEPNIDEPERKFFSRSRKLQFYESARKGPAIFVLHFRLSLGQGLGKQSG